MNTATMSMTDWIIPARAPERAGSGDDDALIKGIIARGAGKWKTGRQDDVPAAHENYFNRLLYFFRMMRAPPG